MAGKLLDGVRTSFDLKPGHFQETVREPRVSIVEYRDGTKAAVYSVSGVGWTYAGEIEGRKSRRSSPRLADRSWEPFSAALTTDTIDIEVRAMNKITPCVKWLSSFTLPDR